MTLDDGAVEAAVRAFAVQSTQGNARDVGYVAMIERRMRPALVAYFAALDPPSDELALRLADVADMLATVKTDEDGEIAEEYTGGLLSALDHALHGSSGCVEPDEWQDARRQALAKHGPALGLFTPDTEEPT